MRHLDHAPPRPAAALLGLLLLGGLALSGATPAAADPAASTSEQLADANAQAHALREQVDRLELQAATAAEDQAAAADELRRVISEELAAAATLGDLQSEGEARRAQASRRARALYMSGGHGTMVASVLSRSTRGDLGDVLAGMRTVRTLVEDDVTSVEDADARVDEAVTGSSLLQALRLERQQLETASQEASAALASALASQQALLAETDARVVALAEQQRAEEEQAALVRAVEAAARARASAAAASAAGATADHGARPSAPASAEVRAVLAGVQAPSQAAQRAIEAATTMLGRPYEWGAVGPATFDCSGLTSWAYRQAGVNIPRTSRAQYAALPKVPADQLAPGDLVFYASGAHPGSIHHVGIYLGDGLMLHAPRTGDVVKVSALWPQRMFGAVRPAGA